MIRNLAILLLLAGMAAGYTLYSERAIPAPTGAQSQNTAPDFSFKTVDGKKHALKDFEDKVVILNFWASWCAPCVIEFPQMLKLAEMTREDSILLFLSIDEDTADIQKFLKQHGKNAKGPNIIIGHDADKSISRDLFKTYMIPETFIIAPDGTIAEKITGADVIWDAPDMVQKIKSLKK